MMKSIYILGLCIGSLTVMWRVLATQKTVTIGYCPTMFDAIAHFQDSTTIALVGYDSSQEALSKLTQDEVDFVVIGRKARDEEVDPTILVDQFDESATTLVQSLHASDEAAFLLPWTEVEYTQVELVILTDEKGKKMAEHRTPFLYYSSQKEAKQVAEIRKRIGENL